MKDKVLTTLFALLIALIGLGQNNPGVINGFKYAYVPALIYQNNAVDIYGITAYVRNELAKKGLIILPDDVNSWPREAVVSPCLIGRWTMYDKPGGISNSANAGFSIKNCKDEIVYESSSTASHFGYYYDKNAPLAMEKALKPIIKFDYFFSPTLTPTISYPKVETTSETEQSLKSYYDNNTLDPVEGIYQSYQSENLGFYKLAIKKEAGNLKVIVVESELPQWKVGEVKAYLEPSSISRVFAAKWYMGNKAPYQTFATLEANAILSVELLNRQNQKQDSKFIKLYPSLANSPSLTANNLKASGTGFAVSAAGIFATNAHVIADAKRVELTLSNELGQFTYNAKILLKDAKNDVALIQIADTSFKGFSNIPYSLAEAAETGEKVFTIGYPLNDIMGVNYKVNDGIISSSSGIADDIRYFQISVPLQPGNSGGPLFNKDGNVIGITTARLNSDAVGTTVENVNYAIKISYLVNLYNMLPDAQSIQKESKLAGKELQEQVKSLKNYICIIRVY